MCKNFPFSYYSGRRWRALPEIRRIAGRITSMLLINHQVEISGNIYDIILSFVTIGALPFSSYILGSANCPM